jgi:hypothetical protein
VHGQARQVSIHPRVSLKEDLARSNAWGAAVWGKCQTLAPQLFNVRAGRLSFPIRGPSHLALVAPGEYFSTSTSSRQGSGQKVGVEIHQPPLRSLMSACGRLLESQKRAPLTDYHAVFPFRSSGRLWAPLGGSVNVRDLLSSLKTSVRLSDPSSSVGQKGLASSIQCLWWLGLELGANDDETSYCAFVFAKLEYGQ